jgi:hypothetical protein
MGPRKPLKSLKTDSGESPAPPGPATVKLYSCGSAIGWTGTAEATGPGPAPSR